MIPFFVAMPNSSFYLQPGNRITFYGDSITEQRLYTTYAEAFIATRYPRLDVKFFNRGWAGDSSWGGGGGTPAERVQKDIVPVRPTHAVVLLGMNDGGYVPYDPKIEATIKEWYGKVLSEISTHCPGVQFTLARTSPWDDYAHSYSSKGKPSEPWAPWSGYNEVLRRYGAIVKSEAERLRGVFVDFNEPLCDVLRSSHEKDPSVATQIIPDSIHPSAAGHLIMMAELMKAWKADPVVSEVVLDASASKIVKASRTQVSSFDHLSWIQLDESLPFAVDPDDKTMQLVRTESGFDSQLNQEMLRVSGLTPGRYRLEIDGDSVAEFDEKTLGKGINLAILNTPMRRQSLSVLDVVRRESEIEFFAWRHVRRENHGVSGSTEAFQGMEKLVNGLRKVKAEVAKPTAHRFALRPA
jgi:lysophospholipase L1-like esterase